MSRPTAHGAARVYSQNSFGRRRLLAGLGALGAASVLPGCTNDGLKPSGAASDAPTSSTIEHAYGKTTVPPDPKRIVALGQTDIDVLVALGVPPIAVGVFSGDWYSPLHPWNKDAFPKAPAFLDFEEYSVEQILALKPDLITGVMGGMTKKEYDKLSAICPVLAQPKGFTDWNTPMDQHTQMLAQALNKVDKGNELVSAARAKLSAAGAENTGFAGLTIALAERWGETYKVIGPSTPRSKFFTDLGFKTLPELDKLIGKAYSADISSEKLSLVGKADLVLWTTDGGQVEALKKNPVVAGLKSTKEGRSLWSTGMKGDSAFWAMDWGTVLSLPYAIEHVVPQIKLAIDGAPDTKVANFSS
ncbi:ABC transporter substrate-binding protein [Kribbella sandramycini]|uniref:ABC transporter substrate-binding protein n=1 Tax=Kribbella sandramycini TaxID=60450 RepID=A0A7Y4KW99_9ACTN|nr:ABC transporter substrate-binding protein [Kribbella sandramycini]MBB6567654.1 iron complex transport system substrate-binding protein [Kribbella sandramycini]NOL39745.1 ABC transporter substrate-binding protein [Kribbella sandramycini]